MTASNSYYDIDAILAEEELIPCTTLFDFSHLAHLDSDGGTQDQQQQQQHQPRHNGTKTTTNSLLPENSRIKIPLWAVEKWAMLGFVRLQLPRHYGRKARERYDADPGDADLRYGKCFTNNRPNNIYFACVCVSFVERTCISQ